MSTDFDTTSTQSIKTHPMRSPFHHGLVLLAISLMLLSACASTERDYETPTVTLKGLRALHGQGGLPQFEVTLVVINPNRTPLDLVGVAYTIRLAGHDIVKGVGKGYEPIGAYSQGELTLTANTHLFGGIRFISDMVRNKPEDLDYEFEAKLDTGGWRPKLRVTDKGAFSFGRNLATPIESN